MGEAPSRRGQWSLGSQQPSGRVLSWAPSGQYWSRAVRLGWRPGQGKARAQKSEWWGQARAQKSEWRGQGPPRHALWSCQCLGQRPSYPWSSWDRPQTLQEQAGQAPVCRLPKRHPCRSVHRTHHCPLPRRQRSSQHWGQKGQTRDPSRERHALLRAGLPCPL